MRTGLLALTLLAAVAAAKKPNIVLFITDDQSLNTLSKREYSPKVFEHLIDRGTYYENFFAPVSVCCPSRVSLLRSQLAHNHNVTFVNSPWGGYNVYNDYGYNGHALPDFLQQAGFNTYYVGKLMNEHTEENCVSKPVQGFNGSDFLIDPFTYNYWSSAFSRNNQPIEKFPGSYSTDLLKDRALGRLDEALGEDQPFFLGIAPNAPHSWLTIDEFPDDITSIKMHIPAAHWRHATLHATEQLERVPSWNKKGGVSWVAQLPELNETEVAYLDEFFRGRLRAIAAVDELVDAVFAKLAAAGELDNTYFFYTADNGYALGTHRRHPGKTLNFEEDIHVPLLVRGPGVKQGFRNTRDSHNMIDLSATILDLAGAKADYEIDGESIFTREQQSKGTNNLNVVEYWVLGGSEGVFGTFHTNNTYRSLRVHEEADDKTITYAYSVWCTGERELYDLQKDPYQLDNQLAPLNALGAFAAPDSKQNGQAVLPEFTQKLVHRLDALLLVLKTCVGRVCQKPYESLFPDFIKSGGEIATLRQALNPQFDSYFEGLPRVAYSQCALGYQSRFEKPIWDPSWAYAGSAQDSLLTFQQAV